MAKIHYPQGVKRPVMKDYPRKNRRLSKKSKRAKIASAIRRANSGNKYNAHRIYFDGYWFDSRVEVEFYIYLKLSQICFKPHTRYAIIDHEKYKSPITGHVYYIRKHSYTPDFEIDDKKTGQILEIIDIKGRKASSYANLRFDLLSERKHLPVVIVKKRHKMFMQKIRGLKGGKMTPFKLDPIIKKRSKIYLPPVEAQRERRLFINKILKLKDKRLKSMIKKRIQKEGKE